MNSQLKSLPINTFQQVYQSYVKSMPALVVQEYKIIYILCNLCDNNPKSNKKSQF